jgi:tRNA(fMet)-specific endonuclease VapC
MSHLWDTDVMSEFFKGKNPHVARRAAIYLQQHRCASISIITRYEILRGLKARNATRLLTRFDGICQKHQILELTDDVILIAADVWADLRRRGQTIDDNDIFIGATALHHGLILATGNVAHFRRIPGLTVEDWTKP